MYAFPAVVTASCALNLPVPSVIMDIFWTKTLTVKNSVLCPALCAANSTLQFVYRVYWDIALMRMMNLIACLMYLAT